MTTRYTLSDVAYDIEQLYIEGLTEKNISKTLDIPVEMVYDWLNTNGIAEDETTYFGA